MGEIYRKRLFQSATLEDLKQICRDYNIKGFSKEKKSGLVELVLVSLSEEELKEVAEENEKKWIKKGIENAFGMIETNLANSFKSFRIDNENTCEVEMDFVWYKEASCAYIKITDKNIDNPEFDCDCPLGSGGGFCGHFWLGFIFSLKKGYFNLSNWKMMKLPVDFEIKIKNIEITKTKSGGFLLVNKSKSFLQKYIDSEISVREGEIVNFEKKSYNYEGNTVEYYLINLKNAVIGTETIDTMKIRLSYGLFAKKSLKIGDVIKFKGKLVKDKFQGLIVKFIRNVTTEKAGKHEESRTNALTKEKEAKKTEEKQWTIQSSSDVNKTYTVTLKVDGTWKCTCPQFTFRKKLCKHISKCQKEYKR